MAEQTAITDYLYNGKVVHFEINEREVMINATEMAKIFGKNIKDFMRNDNTKSFIEEAIKRENSPFLAIQKEEDLVVSKQKSGTWMHRVLALKFAAWLSPAFELWVYSTIDDILYQEHKQRQEALKETAVRKIQMNDLRAKLLEENEDFRQLERLRKEEARATRYMSKRRATEVSRYQSDIKTQ